MTKGGALKSVLVVEDADLEVNGGRYTLQQGPAIKVRGFQASNIGDRMIKGGDALPVYVLDESDIRSGGGRWRVAAGQARQVTNVIGDTRGIIQGTAIPVFPVDDAGNFDPNWPFTPASLTGLRLWLDAGQITGLNDGDPVVTWEDQSGNGFDVTQGAAAKRPTYRASVINGRPIVRFDGIDDLLRRAGQTFNESNGTILAVYQLNAPTVDIQNLFSSADEASAFLYYVICRVFQTAILTEIQVIQRNNDVADQIRGTTASVTGTPYISGWQSDGAIYSMYRNGITEGLVVMTGANTGDWFSDTPNRDNIVVGCLKATAATQFFRGDLAELCYYSPFLSNADRQLWENYASAKYGISI